MFKPKMLQKVNPSPLFLLPYCLKDAVSSLLCSLYETSKVVTYVIHSVHTVVQKTLSLIEPRKLLFAFLE
ncbi:hypothetical protein L596_009481 [Steinernema carpocapsae]|uniref:Uncharacterized protein n=1 Tax=Steinernema carpocapsae TaxID=34508 RepID=A0A4U5PFH2_STECR|nr:hypothetical protein L596_009481 [Steinernema carpocapsae]